LLEYILNDDPIASKRLFLTGLDVNMVCGMWAEDILSAAWRASGKFNKQFAPFFICNHENEALRPRLVHVAIYFNRKKCIKLLVELNVDIDNRVWMSDVKERGPKLFINEKRIKKPEACVIKTSYLAQECADKQVYAIVEGMLKRNETKWKALSLDIEKDITELFLGQWLKDEPVSPSHEASGETTVGAVAGDKIIAASEEQASVEADPAKTGSSRGALAETSARENREADNITDGLPESFTLQLPDIIKDKVKAKGKRSHLRPSMTPKPDIPDWRLHPIAHKLEGPAVIVKSSVNRRDVPLLGKRSFWLESRSWYVAEVAQREAEIEKKSVEFRRRQHDLLHERNKIVNNAAISEEDSLVPAHRSTYDLPLQPSGDYALLGRGMREPIADRKHRMRAILNKRFHTDIDD
jgi:hypothetical protein